MRLMIKEANTAHGIAKGTEPESGRASGSCCQFAVIEWMKKHAEWKYQRAINKIQTLGKSTGQKPWGLQQKNCKKEKEMEWKLVDLKDVSNFKKCTMLKHGV